MGCGGGFPDVGRRFVGARALAGFGGLVEGAWIGGIEVCDPANGWVVRGGGDGCGGMVSSGCGGEQGWFDRFAVSGGRGGGQDGDRAGREHREGGCERYTDRVHCLEAGGKWVVGSDEPRGAVWGSGGRKAGGIVSLGCGCGSTGSPGTLVGARLVGCCRVRAGGSGMTRVTGQVVGEWGEWRVFRGE